MNVRNSMIKQSGPASLSVITRCPLKRGVRSTVYQHLSISLAVIKESVFNPSILHCYNS